MLACTAEAADVGLAGVGVGQRLLNGGEGGVQLSANDGKRSNDDNSDQSGNEAILDGRDAFVLLDQGLQPIQRMKTHNLSSKEFKSANLIDDYQKN